MTQTKHIALFCADYRGEDANREVIDGLDTADRLVALGSSLGLLDEARRQLIFEDIKDLCSLHGCRAFVIVDHMNCGKYRVLYGVEEDGKKVLDAAAERKLHESNLAAAKAIVESRFPNLEVRTLLLEYNVDDNQLVLPEVHPLAHA